MDQLRIIFMGTPDFAVSTLEALLAGPDQVVAVVSQPDRKKGRGKKLSPTPVKETAMAAGIPVLQPTKIKTDQFKEELAAYKPDVIIVAAYGRILPKHLLELAPYGCINVHGSILPKYRGAAPIQWAVINGDKEAGVSIMQMDEGMDTGDILHISTITPDENETAGSLFWKLAELGGKALLETLETLKQGKLTPIQQDHEQASHAPMLTKEDGHIDWQQSAQSIHSRIRGLDPWPSAYCFLNEKRFRLFAPEIVHMDTDRPAGTVIHADKSGLLVATGFNCINIQEIQPEGKKRMPVEAYINGQPIPSGSLLS